jgi:L-lysine exporter family protein LysE/ArgO
MALLLPVVGVSQPSIGEAALLLLGMFLAASSWWVCLTGGVSLLRSRLSPAMLRAVNHVAGAVLTFYGALALARSAGR